MPGPCSSSARASSARAWARCWRPSRAWRTRESRLVVTGKGDVARYQSLAARLGIADAHGLDRTDERRSSASTPPPTWSRCPRATSPSATCIWRPSPPACRCSRSARAGGSEIVSRGENGWVVAEPDRRADRRGPRRAPRRAGGRLGVARAGLRRAVHLRRAGPGVRPPSTGFSAADRPAPAGAHAPNPRFSLINRGHGITLRFNVERCWASAARRVHGPRRLPHRGGGLRQPPEPDPLAAAHRGGGPPAQPGGDRRGDGRPIRRASPAGTSPRRRCTRSIAAWSAQLEAGRRAPRRPLRLHPPPDVRASRRTVPTATAASREPGLLTRAATELGLDLGALGDGGRQALRRGGGPVGGHGRRCSCSPATGAGSGSTPRPRGRIKPDHVAEDLLDAVDWALARVADWER